MSKRKPRLILFSTDTERVTFDRLDRLTVPELLKIRRMVHEVLTNRGLWPSKADSMKMHRRTAALPE